MPRWRDRLEHAVREGPTSRAGRGAPARRPRVLPLGPMLILWAAAIVLLQMRAGLPPDAPGGRLAATADLDPGAPVVLGNETDERRLRFAYALLARDAPERARRLLLKVRASQGDHPVVLRALARCEKALGHREQAAEAYGRLLRARADDVEALRFFLAHRWEDDDLEGALAVARRLERLHALEGEADLLARRIEAEWHARRLMAAER